MYGLFDCYRPQTKFAKVMFLHVSVSHSVHRGVSAPGGAWPWGVPGPGRVHGLEAPGPGGVPGPWGCLVHGVPGPRGGGCLVPGTATAVGSTHLLECILVFGCFYF